jgi:hypothetical protein
LPKTPEEAILARNQREIRRMPADMWELLDGTGLGGAVLIGPTASLSDIPFLDHEHDRHIHSNPRECAAR